MVATKGMVIQVGPMARLGEPPSIQALYTTPADAPNHEAIRCDTWKLFRPQPCMTQEVHSIHR